MTLAPGLYVVTLVVTAAVNVPLNDRLDATEPEAQARAARAALKPWDVVRTVLCTASLISLVPPLS